MPFDGSSDESRALLDLGRPSLKALAYVLRHEELWPRNEDGSAFVWNYASCQTCAMEIVGRLWKNVDGNPMMFFDLPGVTLKMGMRIFGGAHREDNGNELCRQCDVTPSRVADLIEQHLTTEPAP